MKKSLLMLTVVSLAAAATPALAQNPDANRCLRVQDIKDTTTPNASTILFHMRDGTVWRNSLKSPCSGLTWDGFVHKNFGVAEYCGNKEIVQSINTGQHCMLGDFSREKPKKPRG